MLILFKPWFSIEELKGMDNSWVDAYSLFLSTCHPCISHIINNMQLMHECRDSRDDHFAKRNIERRNMERRAARNSNNERNDFGRDEIDETEILAHLEDIEKSWSEKTDRGSQTVDECLKYACNSGLIDED